MRRRKNQEQLSGQSPGSGAPDDFNEKLRDCLDSAVHFLGYRARSEQEVRQRLLRRGFNSDVVDAAVARLRERDLINDRVFAESWSEDRDAFKPRSRWLIQRELKQKGIAGDVIEQAIEALDDKESAYRAASARARSLPGSDFEAFSRRMGEYLKRRGFGYGIINEAVERVWKESASAEPVIEKTRSR